MGNAQNHKQILINNYHARPVMRVPWKSEIFHDRIGSGLRVDFTSPTQKFSYRPEAQQIDTDYYEADHYLIYLCSVNFACSI